MQILLLLMLLDELTGVARAFYLRRLSSAIGVHGLLRKGSIIVLIVAVHIIQPLIPGAPTLDVWFTAAFAFFELLSVAENVGDMGVPLPAQLVGVMRAFGEGVQTGRIVKTEREIRVDDPDVPDVHEKTVSLETTVHQGPTK